ncbi:hypothetical protein BDP27DRAFT_1416103 [Rhodocollybia butyracea]|uniref:Uncharacterized protein n=1 Tax=Rhodocollybia butyracea TaxID=206335 RepID=A0A9P5UDX9_9AGAR|nr:hypothetical protein BDP27DRAFT_1416103 [Rhodocollybia butyracea]
MYYRCASSSLDSDDNEPPSKKAKKPEPVIFRVIVLVSKEVVACPGTRKPASSSKFNIANFVQKNPFKFGSTDKYSMFLGGIASVMDCSVKLLCPTKLQYKMKTPATSPILAMGSEIAFKGLTDVVENILSHTRNDFDYEELLPEVASTSITAQKMKFNEVVGPQRDVLENKYKINNYPDLFPNKRMFKGPCGGFWELDSLAIGNWASHMSQGNATLSKPPLTPFFDYNRCKLPPTTTSCLPQGESIAAPMCTPITAPMQAPAANWLGSYWGVKGAIKQPIK